MKIDCSSILKDGKIQAVHNLLEHRTTAKKIPLVGDFIHSEAYRRKSRGREATVNGDVVSNELYSRTTNT